LVSGVFQDNLLATPINVYTAGLRTKLMNKNRFIGIERAFVTRYFLTVTTNACQLFWTTVAYRNECDISWCGKLPARESWYWFGRRGCWSASVVGSCFPLELLDYSHRLALRRASPSAVQRKHVW